MASSFSSTPPLFLRADASAEIGAGHVMRCLSLGRAWRRRGGDFVFIARVMGEPLAQRVAESGGTLHWLGSLDDAKQTALIAAAGGAAAVVIDGYSLTVDHDRACRAVGLVTLVVDDNAEHGRFESDFVLNQNIHADERLYSNRDPRCELLLGLRFALLREEFAALPPKAIAGRARRVLASFGASDVGGLSLELLEQIAVERSDLEVRLIVGALHPDRAALERAASRCVNVTLLFDVRSMVEQMRWADVAVLAAGSTIWEAAAVGLPAAVVVVADNQRALAHEAQRRGVVRVLGEADTTSGDVMLAAIRELGERFSERAEMSTRGQQLVDGLGADRVASLLLERSSAAK